jgi:hypothetical protein
LYHQVTLFERAVRSALAVRSYAIPRLGLLFWTGGLLLFAVGDDLSLHPGKVQRTINKANILIRETN